MNSLSDVAVVIPAYKPETVLVDLILELEEKNIDLICVVDDGSGSDYRAIFTEIRKRSSVIFLQHDENEGKGAALKTAFRYIHENAPNIVTVVSADADGQHRVDDILKVAKVAINKSDSLVLGVRQFQGSVPLRSKFGNVLTRYVFQIFSRKNVSDTQTGLRGIPVKLLSDLEAIKSNRYQYELEAMLTALESGYEIQEIPIETVYISGNESSHFRPVLDSLRIYLVFLRYGAVSLISFALDVLLFFLLITIYPSQIMVSTYGARLLSGSFNFFVNRSIVFKAEPKRTLVRHAIGYVALAFTIATLSGGGVYLSSVIFGFHPVVAKVIVDTLLFFVSFLTQRYLIFNR